MQRRVRTAARTAVPTDLGGAIRYRINGNDDDGDDDNNFDNTPPLASPASDGEECLERAEANQDGGAAFF